jgi:hypothetical protein
VLFCTVTALGLIRLVCQPKLMGTVVKSSAEASGVLEAFCRQPGVSLAPQDHDAWPGFHQLLRSADLPQLPLELFDRTSITPSDGQAHGVSRDRGDR